VVKPNWTGWSTWDKWDRDREVSILGATGWDWDRGFFRVGGTGWDSGQVSVQLNQSNCPKVGPEGRGISISGCQQNVF